MRTALLIVAALLVVFGAVFTLQGIGVLGGSAMTGDRTWAIIGPVLVIVGIIVGLVGLRRRAGSRP
jgi:hypothetical protein